LKSVALMGLHLIGGCMGGIRVALAGSFEPQG
jgi:hypothetical protein